MERMYIALFKERAKAEPARERLRQAGFRAEIQDHRTLELLWFVPQKALGARLEVPAEQFERAEHFLLGCAQRGEPVLEGAIRCPECGSLRVEYPQTARHSFLTNLWVGLGAEFGLVEKDYYCEDCHLTWPRHGNGSPPKQEHGAPFYFIEDPKAEKEGAAGTGVREEPFLQGVEAKKSGGGR